MPDLTRAPRDIVDFVNQVCDDYHPDLVEAGVTIGVLMAMATDAEHESGEAAPFLKYHGYPAAAVVEKESLKARVKGVADATITIDDRRWRLLDEPGRVALIDHELTHLVLQIGEDGEIRLDKANRPVLKIRNHDFEIGIFNSVISRHGMKSIDAQNVSALFGHYKQKLMDWASDAGPRDEMPDLEAIAGAIGR